LSAGFSDFEDEYFLNEALKLARQAFEEDEVPIGALIVSNRQILSKGWNQVEKLKDVTAHAEMLAITAAAGHLGSKYLKNCTLYVTIEPCPMCAAALGWSQISRIVYGAPDAKRGYSLFQPSLLHPKTEVTQLFHLQDCGLLLQKFFKQKRKQ
jgi:tRNA(adenine34) deaminase